MFLESIHVHVFCQSAHAWSLELGSEIAALRQIVAMDISQNNVKNYMKIQFMELSNVTILYYIF